MERVGIATDALYLEHEPLEYHPENPGRLRAIHDMLDQPDMKDRFVRLPLREATLEELCRIHTETYIRRIESTRGTSGQRLDPDTYVSSETYRVARYATGALLALVDALHAGTIEAGFALVRPPGHHAEAARGMGFCIYNNVAVAARYAQGKGFFSRILIVDWDLHHGNGTQHSFESDPSVLYLSSHMYPYYPGTGRLEEIGVGEGTGYTVNIPLPGGQGDRDYLWIYEKAVLPIAEQFRPDLILISAGFDIYAGDPLGTMNVTEPGFAGLAALLQKAARTCCRGRILFSLEGGYHQEGQARSVRAVLNQLNGHPEGSLPQAASSPTSEQILRRLQAVQKDYWKF